MASPLPARAACHNGPVSPHHSSPVDRPALPPHAPLPDYYHDEDDHQRFLRRIFDDTAVDYDRIERLLAFGSGPWYRRQALRRAGLVTGMHVLDVGVGTGLLARQALALVAPGGDVTGVDPSAGMMAQANLPDVTLLHGRAEELPVADATFDYVSMGYALRHLSDLNAAFAEVARVLRPGGRLLLLEITRPAGRVASWMLRHYMRALVPAAARWVTGRAATAQLWRYYWDTIEACIAPATVLDALRRAGFEGVQRHVELGIFSEYTARRRAS
jgi:demethylmenaquinone methyltransferase / 2-methoxy-6-polyprenyl-1,4-benzoquinol methylase